MIDLELKDVYLGAKLICVDSGSAKILYTENTLYEITSVNSRSEVDFIITDNLGGRSGCRFNINDGPLDNFVNPTFAPLRIVLSEREMFLYEMTGKLPEYINEKAQIHS